MPTLLDPQVTWSDKQSQEFPAAVPCTGMVRLLEVSRLQLIDRLVTDE